MTSRWRLAGAAQARAGLVGWGLCVVLLSGGVGCGDDAADDPGASGDASGGAAVGGQGGDGATAGSGNAGGEGAQGGGAQGGAGGQGGAGAAGGMGGAGGSAPQPNPDAECLLVSSGGQAAQAVDLAADPPMTFSLPGMHALAISRDGKQALGMADDQKQLLHIDLTFAPPIVTPLPGWNHLMGGMFDDDGDRAFVRGRRTGEEEYFDYVIELDGTVVTTHPLNTFIYNGVTSPDGAYNLQVSYLGIGVMDTDDGETYNFEYDLPGDDIEDVVWAPTSDRFAYVHAEDVSTFRIVVVTRAPNGTWEPELLTDAEDFYNDDFPPTFSPDGERLAFEDQNGVQIADLSGDTPVLHVVPDAYGPRGFGFSPDGVFFAGTAFERHWYVDALPLGQPAVIKPNAQTYLAHAWSSSGRWFCQYGPGAGAATLLWDMAGFPNDVGIAKYLDGCRFRMDETAIYTIGDGKLWDMTPATPVSHAVHAPGDVHRFLGMLDRDGELQLLWERQDWSIVRRVFNGTTMGPVQQLFGAPPSDQYTWNVRKPSSVY